MPLEFTPRLQAFFLQGYCRFGHTCKAGCCFYSKPRRWKVMMMTRMMQSHRLVLRPPVLQPPSRSALTGICHLPFSKPRPICSKRNSVAIKPRHPSVISIPGITFGRRGRGSCLLRAAIACLSTISQLNRRNLPKVPAGATEDGVEQSMRGTDRTNAPNVRCGSESKAAARPIEVGLRGKIGPVLLSQSSSPLA